MNFKNYIDYIEETLQYVNEGEIDTTINILLAAFIAGRNIFVIGNGGSASTASHFAQDLVKGTCLSLDQTKRVKAMSLTDNISFITATSNDDSYDIIFEQQLMTFAKSEDILVAISGSGNSKNIIKAVDWANENEMKTIGITGFDGGELKKIAQNNIHVNLDDMCSAESIHSIILHYIIIELKKQIHDFFIFKEYYEDSSC